MHLQYITEFHDVKPSTKTYMEMNVWPSHVIGHANIYNIGVSQIRVSYEYTVISFIAESFSRTIREDKYI